MRKKDYLARGFAASGLYGLCDVLRRMVADELPILAYHRVYDIEEEDAFPFDPSLVSASREGFAWQMQYVQDQYNPITFQSLCDALDGKMSLPKRPLIVTFDDGYDDNYHHAFPVLKSLGVPATFFVSTGYIGSSKPFWFDQVAYILYHAPASTLSFADLQLTLPLNDIPSRRVAAVSLIRALKKVGNDRRLAFLDRFEREYASVADAPSLQQSHPMNWEQVREMHAAGMEFGSHAVTHPVLSRVDDVTLERELVESRSKLERELGTPVTVLAYPVGVSGAFNDKVICAARAAGYRLGVSYIEGVNRLDRLEHFNLHRQHVERNTSKYFFVGLLKLPEFFW